MDLKGQIVDTKITIIPSPALTNFISSLKYKDGMPVNIAKIIKGSKYESTKTTEVKVKVNLELTKEEIKILKQLRTEAKAEEAFASDEDDKENARVEDNKELTSGNKDKENVETESEKKTSELDSKTQKGESVKNDLIKLNLDDVDWLYVYLQKSRKDDSSKAPYLHELLEGSKILTPENAVLKRNPELEARCVKLRSQQEAREYRAMTKGVDNVRMRFPEDSIAYQLKQLNRQLIAVGQFLLSIFAGFLFGFTGVELMIGGLDFGFRLLLGVMCALVIALAEIYFLAKKLNEEMSVPETTQIGGPPKFANMPDPQKPGQARKEKTGSKEHQE